MDIKKNDSFIPFKESFSLYSLLKTTDLFICPCNTTVQIYRVNHSFAYGSNICIWPIDWNLYCACNSGKSRPGISSLEGVLHFCQSSSIIGA